MEDNKKIIGGKSTIKNKNNKIEIGNENENENQNQNENNNKDECLLMSMDHISKSGVKRRTKKTEIKVKEEKEVQSLPVPRTTSIRRGRISKQNTPYKESEEVKTNSNNNKNEEKVYYLDEERQYLTSSLQKYGNLVSSMGIQITSKRNS
jgi:hypothetical protein